MDSTSNTFVIVPHGWQRLVDKGRVIYISPDGITLSSREELLRHLTSAGTCKCGLRCPFMIDEAFTFNPDMLGLPDNIPFTNQMLCSVKPHLTLHKVKRQPPKRLPTKPKLLSPKSKPSTKSVSIPLIRSPGKTKPSDSQSVQGLVNPKIQMQHPVQTSMTYPVLNVQALVTHLNAVVQSKGNSSNAAANISLPWLMNALQSQRQASTSSTSSAYTPSFPSIYFLPPSPAPMANSRPSSAPSGASRPSTILPLTSSVPAVASRPSSVPAVASRPSSVPAGASRPSSVSPGASRPSAQVSHAKCKEHIEKFSFDNFERFAAPITTVENVRNPLFHNKGIDFEGDSKATEGVATSLDESLKLESSNEDGLVRNEVPSDATKLALSQATSGKIRNINELLQTQENKNNNVEENDPQHFGIVPTRLVEQNESMTTEQDEVVQPEEQSQLTEEPVDKGDTLEEPNDPVMLPEKEQDLEAAESYLKEQGKLTEEPLEEKVEEEEKQISEKMMENGTMEEQNVLGELTRNQTTIENYTQSVGNPTNEILTPAEEERQSEEMIRSNGDEKGIREQNKEEIIPAGGKVDSHEQAQEKQTNNYKSMEKMNNVGESEQTSVPAKEENELTEQDKEKVKDRNEPTRESRNTPTDRGEPLNEEIEQVEEESQPTEQVEEKSQPTEQVEEESQPTEQVEEKSQPAEEKSQPTEQVEEESQPAEEKSQPTEQVEEESQPAEQVEEESQPAEQVEEESQPAEQVEEESQPTEQVEEKSQPAEQVEEESPAEQVEEESQPAEQVEEESQPAEQVEEKSQPTEQVEEKSQPAEQVEEESQPAEQVEEKSQPTEQVEEESQPAEQVEEESQPAEQVEGKSQPAEQVEEKSQPAEQVEEKSQPAEQVEEKSQPAEQVEEKSQPMNEETHQTQELHIESLRSSVKHKQKRGRKRLRKEQPAAEPAKKRRKRQRKKASRNQAAKVLESRSLEEVETERERYDDSETQNYSSSSVDYCPSPSSLETVIYSRQYNLRKRSRSSYTVDVTNTSSIQSSSQQPPPSSQQPPSSSQQPPSSSQQPPPSSQQSPSQQPPPSSQQPPSQQPPPSSQQPPSQQPPPSSQQPPSQSPTQPTETRKTKGNPEKKRRGRPKSQTIDTPVDTCKYNFRKRRSESYSISELNIKSKLPRQDEESNANLKEETLGSPDSVFSSPQSGLKIPFLITHSLSDDKNDSFCRPLPSQSSYHVPKKIMRSSEEEEEESSSTCVQSDDHSITNLHSVDLNDADQLIVSISRRRLPYVTRYSTIKYYSRSFKIGDVVWAKANMLPSWPGKIISHTEWRNKLGPAPDGQVWVKWFCSDSVSLVEQSNMKDLREHMQTYKMNCGKAKRKKRNKLYIAMEAAAIEAKKTL